MSNKRLIDPDKLLNWIYNGNAAGFTIGELTSLINLGYFNASPSNQGEAARLREALEKIVGISEDAMLTDEDAMREILRTTHEALSSHTEDTGIQKVRERYMNAKKGYEHPVDRAAEEFYNGNMVGITETLKSLGITIPGISDGGEQDA